jgi:pseudaminic acid cytidylyltransferase
MKKCLCLIPARGGSKRIPRKNVKNFLGKPIINYAIEAALDSKLFSEVMVSTEDAEIATIAKNCGAVVPFMRSQENANDFAPTVEVILEVLKEYGARGQSFEYVCCIYPTAPFVSGDLMKETLKSLEDNQAEALVPVLRFGFPIQRAVKIENQLMKMFQPEHMFTRSQDLEKSYHDAGQFYWVKVSELYKQKKLYMDKTVAFELDEMLAHDIDTPKDWEIAEFKFSLMNQK